MKQRLLHILLCVMALATTTQVRADWNDNDLNWRVKLTSALTSTKQYITIEYPEENYVGLYNDGIYNVSISTPDGEVFYKKNPKNNAMTTDGYGYHCITSTREVEENSLSAGADARYRTVSICMKSFIKQSEYRNFTVTIAFDLYIDKTGDNASPNTQYHFSKTFTSKELLAEGLLCPNINKKAFTYSEDKLNVGCTLSSLPDRWQWSPGLMYSDPANSIYNSMITDSKPSFDIYGVERNIGGNVTKVFDEYDTNRTFTITPLAYSDFELSNYKYRVHLVSDNSETLTVGRRRLSNLRLTRGRSDIQLDWDITAGGSPGGLVTIKRRALGEVDFKVVRTLPDDVTTYYDSSVDPNTFSGTYSITYQGAYDSTPDEKATNKVGIFNNTFNKPVWLLSDSIATLCYKNFVDNSDEVLGLFDADKEAWAGKANSVVIDASMASYPLESAFGLFSGMNNVRSIEGLQYLNLQQVTNMERMFMDCKSLESLDLSTFNTANVTDMYGMFWGCKSLESLDLSTFNTANVTDMYGMFSGCNSLKSLDLSAFSTANVTDMNNMFYNCSSLTSVDLSAFNTEKVTKMSMMFYNCNSLKSLDLSAFNTKNVTDMSGMFNGCSSLESLDLSAFNTANVTNMSGMFRDCSLLTTLNLASFSARGESNPNLESMFDGCKSLNTIYSHSFVGGADCKVFLMFNGCTSLKGAVPFDPFRADGAMATFDGYFTPAIKGDLNGDGRVSIADITRLVKRMSQHGNTYHYQADMNEDGNVTLDDLKLLVDTLIGQK